MTQVVFSPITDISSQALTTRIDLYLADEGGNRIIGWNMVTNEPYNGVRTLLFNELVVVDLLPQIHIAVPSSILATYYAAKIVSPRDLHQSTLYRFQVPDSQNPVQVSDLLFVAGIKAGTALADRLLPPILQENEGFLPKIVNGEVVWLSPNEAILPMFDDYTSSEFLDDQSGADAVLTFTFSSPVNQVWVDLNSTDIDATGRVRTDGVDPTALIGAPIRDKVPVPLTVTTSSVKVYAPAGSVVRCWGFRR